MSSREFTGAPCTQIPGLGPVVWCKSSPEIALKCLVHCIREDCDVFGNLWLYIVSSPFSYVDTCSIPGSVLSLPCQLSCQSLPDSLTFIFRSLFDRDFKYCLILVCTNVFYPHLFVSSPMFNLNYFHYLLLKLWPILWYG